MATKVLSIEIGLKSTRICEIDYGKKNPCIYQHFSFIHPENCVEDGLIRDKETYSALLNEYLKKNGIKNTNVIFTIASNKIANREVIIPYVANNKIAQIIEASANEYFPMDLSEYTISHRVLEKKNHKDDKSIRVLVLAAPAELIRGYYDIARMTGLHVVSLDYSGNSYFQIISKEIGKGLNLCVNIDEMTSIVTIVDNGMLALQRTIAFGSYDLVNAVINQPVLGIEDEEKAFSYLCDETVLNYQFPVSETKEVVNFQVGFEGFNKAKAEQRAKEEITLVVRDLLRHLSRILDYFNSKSNGRNVTTLYLSGVGAKIIGITQLLNNVTGLEVRSVDAYYSIHTVNERGKQKENMVEYATCMGSVINPITFILPEVLSTKALKSNRTTMTVIFGLSVALSIVLIAFSLLVKQNAENEKKEVEDQIEAKKYVVEVKNEYDAAKASFEEYEALFNASVTPNEFLNETIAAFEASFPSDTVISSLSISGNSITLTAKNADMINVGELLLQIKKIPYVTNVFIPTITENNDSDLGTEYVDYTIMCNYAVTGTEDKSQLAISTSQE